MAQDEKEEEEVAVVSNSTQLDIDVDYYSISFVSFLVFYQATHKITRNDLSNIMYNVLFVFAMQMILVVLIGYTFVGDLAFAPATL